MFIKIIKAVPSFLLRCAKQFVIDIDKWIRRVAAAWVTVSFFLLLLTEGKFEDKSFAQETDLKKYILGFVTVVILLFIIDKLFSWLKIDDKVLFTFAFIYALALASKATEVFFFPLAVISMLGILLYYMVRHNSLLFPIPAGSKFKLTNKATFVLVCLCGAFFAYIVGTISTLRYVTYSAPNYDFGLFCQMFHYMKTTFLPLVTSERHELMSHFAVHISPIFYLLLPVYYIFPSPITLQISQAVILASGVIPLYLLAKKYKINNYLIVFLTAAYALYPALSSGAFYYDMHENFFLAPLLLWVFYFFEKEKYIPMYIFAVLVFCVKEDAPIYIALFALYVFFGRKKYMHGSILFAAAVLYFVGAITLLATYGDAVMTNRYDNYIYEDGGLVSMIKTVIINPGYVFTQLFKGVFSATNGEYVFEKLQFILLMLVPVGFMPFITKKFSRYILICPFLLFNLMTMYSYQFKINFQYNFGVIAFFFYLTVMNVADLRNISRRFALSFCAVAAAVIFTTTAMPKYTSYVDSYNEGRELVAQMDEIIETIPDDAAVISSTFLLPHISQRDILYEVHYLVRGGIDREAEYLVLDMRPGYAHDSREFMSVYLKKGYEVYAVYDDMITILINPHFNPENVEVKH